MKKNIKGSLILLIAAFIWGTAFAAQSAGAERVSNFTFNCTRCSVGALFLLIVVFVRDAADKRDEGEKDKSWPVIPGLICGVVLFLAMNFQQAGIGLYPTDAASSGRSGFLTAMYVIFVAVVEQIRVMRKGSSLSPAIIAAVLGAICGLYLLCFSGGIGNIYTGDVLELLCAVCFTAHILVIDRFKKVDSVKLSCIQFAMSGALSFFPMILIEVPKMSDIIAAGGPILYAGILSSGVAFTLQMVGQKYARPAVAAIVMCLESVFAVLAGAILLGEVMSAREVFGCVIMFAAVIVAQLPAFLPAASEAGR